MNTLTEGNERCPHCSFSPESASDYCEKHRPKLEDLMTTEVIVKQNEEKPVPVEILAESIVAISGGIKKLLAGPMNEKALLLLIQHASPTMGSYPSRKVNATEIRAVLAGIEALERTYLKPKKKAEK